MCGRYTQTQAGPILLSRFRLEDTALDLKPRYNIAPGQEAPVVIHEATKTPAMMRWGLVPSWAKDPAIGNKMINARAETITEKPSFKRLIERRRCLVLADGFYEWRKEERGKVPMRFVLKNRDPFAFAGLWDRWRTPDGAELRTFTIITTAANELMRPVHDRMPVILAPDAEEPWLDAGSVNPAAILSSLKPYPSESMEAYDVTTLVNSPKNDRPECIAEVVYPPSWTRR